MTESEARGMPRESLRLVLPLPPSPNRSSKAWQGSRAKKNGYRMECWAAAVAQCCPSVAPPFFVVIDAEFFVVNLRDEDNLKASLKPVLDALKQVQTGKKRDWKGNDVRGFFWDDDPRHCTVNEPSQCIDRKNPRLELTISTIEGAVTSTRQP